MSRRDQFNRKVEFEEHKMKKAQINYETLKWPTLPFGLGIIKLGQLISKLKKWIWNVYEML